MIISLRGTSGAGKSHLVRRILAAFPPNEPQFIAGRRKPYWILCGGRLAVIGHYDIKNGGVDTLKTLHEAYGLAIDLHKKYNVLMEGKNMSDGTNHVRGLLVSDIDVRVVHIVTSVDECVEAVRGRGHRIARQSIEKTDRKVRQNIADLRAMGMSVFQGDRESCFAHVRELLCTSQS